MAAKVAQNPSPSGGDPRKSAFLILYGEMEGAVMFCAVALMVGPSWLPLLAALIPLGVMASQFPRADVPRTG